MEHSFATAADDSAMTAASDQQSQSLLANQSVEEESTSLTDEITDPPATSPQIGATVPFSMSAEGIEDRDTSPVADVTFDDPWLNPIDDINDEPQHESTEGMSPIPDHASVSVPFDDVSIASNEQVSETDRSDDDNNAIADVDAFVYTTLSNLYKGDSN